MKKTSSNIKFSIDNIVGFFLISILAALPFIFIFNAFLKSEQMPLPEPAFTSSEYVTSGLTGQKGQIIKVFCTRGASTCTYRVRFASKAGASTANGRFLHGASEVVEAPFVLVTMWEYELEKLS